MMSLSFSFLILFLCLQEAQPVLTVDVGPAEPNKVVIMRMTVENPNTADLLWNSKLRIEEVHPNFVAVKTEYKLSDKIQPGQRDIGELSIQVKREAEAGEYPVVISLSGGVGACEEGCVPYFIEREVMIRVMRNTPEVAVTHTVEGTKIVITIENKGISRVQNVSCDGVSAGIIQPGEKKEVTIEKKGTFTLTYEDEYGKEFSQSYRIVERRQESSLQWILVVMGIFLYWRLRN